MKLNSAIALAAILSYVSAHAVESEIQPRLEPRVPGEPGLSQDQELWKRKGGGRGGSRGSNSGSGSGGGGGRAPSGGSLGGRAVTGRGPQPNYGGGRFYGGGAAAPYQTGQRSPVGNIAPFALIGVAAIAFWPGTWYSPYRLQSYRHNDDYTFFNATVNATQSKPVMCACAEDFPCGCDVPETNAERDEWLDELVGDGNYDDLNKTIIDVGDYEGESTILLNGTLPYDTVLEDPEASAAGIRAMLEALGWWPMGIAALAAVAVA